MENKYGMIFRITRALVRIVYPRYKMDLSHVKDGPTVFISHHQNLFGPFIMLLWLPIPVRTWILHVFLERKLCFKQYADYTFTERFGWNKYVAKIIAFPISFFISALLTSGKGIPVYRGTKKILRTFQESVAALENGENILIFPDIDYTDGSSEMKDMYEGFLNLEKYYYKKTGQHITFIPILASKDKRLIKAGEPVLFKGKGKDFKAEREVVYEAIQKELNTLATEFLDR